jgi:hypothetical protein
VKGLLVVTDAIEGVHLIDVSGRSDQRVGDMVHALTGFLAASADGPRSWLTVHDDVALDDLPRAVTVWPSFEAFFSQFGMEWQDLDNLNDEEDT